MAWRELHFGLGGPDQLIKQATCYLLLVPLFVAVGVSSENESAALGLLIPIGLLLLPITLALHVSRGLRLEVDSRSLPALAGLPHPLSALLHMKRLGALLNALPCGLLIVIGYVCSDEAASLLSRRHERTFLTINDCVLLSYAVAVIMSTQTSLCVSLWSRSAALLGSALMWWVTFLLTLALTLLGREDAGRRRAGVVYELLDQLGLNGLTLALLGAIAGAAATLALLERASRRRLRQLAAN